MTESEFQLQQMAYSIARIRQGEADLPYEELPSRVQPEEETSLMTTDFLSQASVPCSVTLLASGSRGNAAFIRCGQTKILIDAGISYRRLEQRLQQCHCLVSDLDAVFLTHEHADHVSGLPILLKHSHMPVYTTLDTWQALGKKVADYSSRFVRLTRRVSLGDVQVIPFAISHDAARPVGYSLISGGTKLTLATDLGFVSPEVEQAAAYADILVLEANHDEQMVQDGPYPYYLQQRILGRLGHLSNTTAATLLARLPRRKAMKILLAHRSAKNNTPALTVQTIRKVLADAGLVMGQDILVRLACQSGQVRFQNKE